MKKGDGQTAKMCDTLVKPVDLREPYVGKSASS